MIENQIVLDFIGKTKTNNLLNDVSKIFLENMKKQFPNYNQDIKAISIITVNDQNQNEIKSIGMSCINDILNDNFATFFMRMWGGADTIATMKDITNTSFDYTINTTETAYNDTNGITPLSLGSRVQVGKGTTPATRQDFNIENPFSNGGVEDNRNITGDGGYNNPLGKITIPTLITPVTSSGSISESVLFGTWRSTAGVKNNVFSRDNILPLVNFIVGQSININYELVFT